MRRFSSAIVLHVALGLAIQEVRAQSESLNSNVPIVAGDANSDRAVDISDAISILQFLFVDGAERPPHLRPADANRDFTVDISDAIFVLQFLFVDGDAPTIDVPLRRWGSEGFHLGTAGAISFGDVDRDGWIDLFAYRTGTLWRNMEGTDWEEIPAFLGTDTWRYGSSFGDFDNDGLPEIATEPRREEQLLTRCFALLRYSDGEIVDATDEAIPSELFPSPLCGSLTETICWGDIDFDRDLDMFLPAYPRNGSRNFLFVNLGTDEGYRFEERGENAGIINPPDTPNPEGAQFADYDQDGDLDLFSNATLYQNRSTVGTPRFDPLQPTDVGITRATLDEGAAFLDYDHDGDLDLAIAYRFPEQLVIWDNLGDGTFAAAAPQRIEAPAFHVWSVGLSVIDWDNDGDLDLTSRDAFHLNRFLETGGTPGFYLATHDIDPHHLAFKDPADPDNDRRDFPGVVPAWGDWDQDGDVDCALANFFQSNRQERLSHFYENILYGDSTRPDEKQYVRVRPVSNLPEVESTCPVESDLAHEPWLENEFGAVVRINVDGEEFNEHQVHRVQFTSSASGYLNQNEYALTFGLSRDPVINRFDVAVDFPGLPPLRVDKDVNPLLGSLSQEFLAIVPHREIVVFRSGCVRIGDAFEPPRESPTLFTTGTTGAGLPLPVGSGEVRPEVHEIASEVLHVGTTFTSGTASIRLVELIVDGELEPPGEAPFNVALWKMTETPETCPQLAASAIATTAQDNRRSFVRLDGLVAEPETSYRLVVRVNRCRVWNVSAPDVQGVTNLASFSYEHSDSANCMAVAEANADASSLCVAFRFREIESSP